MTRSPESKLTTLAAAAALVGDGGRLGFGGQPALARKPMAFARELIRQGRRGLRVFNQIGGLEVDLMIGAGAVASTNCCYVGLGELGPGPNFQREARAARIEVVEYSEFTLSAGLRAATMDLPFLPWKTAWGTDVAVEQGWKEIRCPYTGTRLLAVPATRLDVAVIQVESCDASGNVRLPDPLEISYDFDYLACRAADRVVVCAERVEPIADPSRVALVAPEVSAVVHAPGGGWPCAQGGSYGADLAHLTDEYLPASRSGRIADYLRAHVHERAD